MIQPLKVKFVNQGTEAYSVDVNSFSDLTKSEQEELIQIFIRLKKKVYHSKKMIESLIEQCPSPTLKKQATDFLTINK